MNIMAGRWKILTLAFAAVAVMAQVPPPPPAEGPAFSQAELDQMLAPIALYPDELLSQVLMAATYPLEIVEAARWSSANPGLRGEQAVSAAAAQPWDPSVKSLLAFPQILSMMDQKLDWTQRLGNAFLAQQQQVMNSVQELRKRAYAAGNLRSSEREVVQDQGGSITIVQASPQVIYVPYYDPFFVYGPWWWPAYPPVYWAPWPGYVVGPAVGIWWGVGVGISMGFFFGAFDWPHYHVVVRPPPPLYHPYPPPGAHPPPPGVWQHDPGHRRGVPYRTETVRREFGQAPRPLAIPPRIEYRGHEAPALQGGPGPRTPPPPPSRAQPPAPVRTPPPAPPRAQPSQPFHVQPSVPPPHAFEGLRAGSERTREFSARGQASMAPRASQPRSAPPAGGARGRR